jgi:translation initiation factor IF-1
LRRGHEQWTLGIDEAVKVEAQVVEERPSAIYKLVLPDQKQILAHLTGMERNFVRLVPGDRVEVEVAPGDPGRGRIMRKL